MAFCAANVRNGLKVLVAFGDVLCITEKSVIEGCATLVLRSTMTAGDEPKYEPGHPIARFCCGELMKLVKTIPRIGSYPELQTYRCERCHNVETIEVKDRRFQARRHP